MSTKVRYIDVEMLEKQAEVVGGKMREMQPSEARSLMEGTWELLHLILDDLQGNRKECVLETARSSSRPSPRCTCSGNRPAPTSIKDCPAQIHET